MFDLQALQPSDNRNHAVHLIIIIYHNLLPLDFIYPSTKSTTLFHIGFKLQKHNI